MISEIPRNQYKNIDKLLRIFGVGLVIPGICFFILGSYLSFFTPKQGLGTDHSANVLGIWIDNYFLGLILIILGNSLGMVGGMLSYFAYVRKKIRESLFGASLLLEID